MNKPEFTVGMVHEACVVCLKKMNYQILFPKYGDTKIIEQINEANHKCIGFSETFCEECQSKVDDGYVPCIIVLDEEMPKSIYDVKREGSIIFLKKVYVQRIFPDFKDQKFIFAGIDFLKHCQEIVNG